MSADPDEKRECHWIQGKPCKCYRCRVGTCTLLPGLTDREASVLTAIVAAHRVKMEAVRVKAIGELIGRKLADVNGALTRILEPMGLVERDHIVPKCWRATALGQGVVAYGWPIAGKAGDMALVEMLSAKLVPCERCDRAAVMIVVNSPRCEWHITGRLRGAGLHMARSQRAHMRPVV